MDIFIPTYNEPLSVVKLTIVTALSQDWPRDKVNIYVLDDGRRDEFRAFCNDVGVGYITRPDNKHAKAGNINAALQHTHGEFIAIFDCDHVPTFVSSNLYGMVSERFQPGYAANTPTFSSRLIRWKRIWKSFKKYRMKGSCFTAWCKMATTSGTQRSFVVRARCCDEAIFAIGGVATGKRDRRCPDSAKDESCGLTTQLTWAFHKPQG